MGTNDNHTNRNVSESAAGREACSGHWRLAPAGLVLTDRAGLVLEANHGITEMLGLPLEALAGAPLERFLTNNGCGGAAGPLVGPLVGLDGLSSPAGRRLALLSGSGRQIPVTVRCTALDSGEGDLLWALMEIPEPPAQPEPWRTPPPRRDEAGAGHSDSFKRQFLANVSHEMRTPMNAIIGMTRLLLEDGPALEQRGILADLDASATALRRIIDTLLDFSGLESGEETPVLENFDLRQTLESVVKGFMDAARRKGLSLKLDIGPDVPGRLHADPGRLRQVAVCLLDNAVKFTSSGEVFVRAWMRSPETLAVEVADTGIGLDEYSLPHIFGAFVQGDLSTTKRYPGAGIGLAICKRLLEAMGGTIEARNAESGGAVFTCVIPVRVVHQAATSRLADPAPSTSLEKPSLRVLLAEDNDVNRRFTTKFLQQRGHQVTAVENGREALAALELQIFDIVLMDISMPEMDGMEATRAIRAHDGSRFDPRIPVVAVTAHALRGDGERFLKAGMDAYLAKPLDLEHFERVILDICSASVACPAPAKPRKAASAQHGDAQPFDPVMQARRFASMMDILPELLALFVKNADSTLDNLRQALLSGRLVDAERAAHTLKGMAAVVCATGVESAAMALEKALAGQEGTDHAPLVAALESQVARAVEHLRGQEGL